MAESIVAAETICQILANLFSGTNVTDWLMAVGTIVLAYIAVFQDKIRTFVHGPKLDCKIELRPPDCHRTEMKGPNIRFYSYYFWFEIWNRGKTSAKNVEVIISDVLKKEGNGFKPIEDFFPDNLVWSLISINGAKVYCDYISPETFKPCNLGHIHDPMQRRVIGEDNPSLPVQNGETIFCFDVNFKSNKLNYLVQPGTYRFTITVGCENAKTIKKKFALEVTGKWFEDESRMLNEGIRIYEAK